MLTGAISSRTETVRENWWSVCSPSLKRSFLNEGCLCVRGVMREEQQKRIKEGGGRKGGRRGRERRGEGGREEGGREKEGGKEGERRGEEGSEKKEGGREGGRRE